MSSRTLAAFVVAAGLAVASPAYAVSPSGASTTVPIGSMLPQPAVTTPMHDFLAALHGPLGLGIAVVAASVGLLVLRDRREHRRADQRVRTAIAARAALRPLSR
jgi:hypothetical protein